MQLICPIACGNVFESQDADFCRMLPNCWADYDLSTYTHTFWSWWSQFGVTTVSRPLISLVVSMGSMGSLIVFGNWWGQFGVNLSIHDMMKVMVWYFEWHIGSWTHTRVLFCFGLVVWYKGFLVVKYPTCFCGHFPCNHIYIVGMQKPGLLIGEDTFQCNVSTSGSFHWTMICQKFIDELAIHNTVLNNKTHFVFTTKLFSWHPSYFWIPEMSWNVKQFSHQCIKGLKQFCRFFQVINLDLKYIVWLSERQVSTVGLEFPELPHVMLLVLIQCKDLLEFWMAVIPLEKQRRYLTCFWDWFWYVTLVFWYITNPIFWETW